MRHRVRLRWREWEHIGASGQVVSWILHGMRVKFKNGLRPRPFNHGVSMKEVTQPQLDFLSTDIHASKIAEPGNAPTTPATSPACFSSPSPG
jgi:hypothetical protein